MTFTHQPKLDRLSDDLGDLLARVEGRKDLPDLTQYRDDPLGFATDILKVNLYQKQEEILRAMQRHKRVCVYGCNSSGKDFAAGCLAAWWIYARGGRVVYQSTKQEQVSEVCFRSNLVRRIKEAGLPGECYAMAVRANGETVALGHTSNTVSRLTGYHFEAGVLLILSEGQGLEEFAWEAAHAVATSELDAILAIGNPLSPVGAFYKASRSPHWESVQIGAKDHPNVSLNLSPGDKGYIAGGPGLKWVQQMRDELSAPQYTARVEGFFPSEAQFGLVKLEWLQEAARKHATGELRAPPTEEAVCGVDVARYGVDASVMAVRRGLHLEEFVRWYDTDTVATTKRIATEGLRFGIHARTDLGTKGTLPPRGLLIIDDVGVGAGVTDQAKAAGFRVFPFSSASRARDHKHLANRRAEAYWHLRKLLEERRIALPDDDELFAELLATEYKTDKSGRTIIEPKDELSARLGRSPDKADATAMCFSDNAQSRQARTFCVSAWLSGRA